mmetsp:Transcript_876/g.1974  ORF Transcript_876/g.1974 Transcript_876/m.1974 type:complete len:481 (-) Transcript_876:29-1471(-)
MAEKAAERDAKLRLRWSDLCSKLGVSDSSKDKWWTTIEGRYSEPQRKYHTMEHLAELFEHMDKHADKLSDPNAVSLAIFFHDIIYEPKAGSPKNEEDSAIIWDQFGQECLPVGKPLGLEKGELISKVCRWIVYTATHKVPEDEDEDCRLFMDFDMAILGSPWERYEEYSKQIREEYIHVPLAIYCKARAKFLSSCTTATTFTSSTFQSSHEQQAKDNMAQEAAALSEQFSSSSVLARVGAQIVLAGSSKRTMQVAGGLLGTGVGLGLLAGAPMATLSVAGSAVGLFGLILAVGARYERYPYRTRPADDKTVVLAGSYNPPHLGHLEMLRYLSKVHKRVVAVIGVNPKKKYDVSPYQRQAILRQMIKELDLPNVEVAVWSSIIFLYARSIGASVMYRGIRSWREDGRAEKYLEFQNLGYQLAFCHWPIPTAYLQGAPHLSSVSSTVLRKRLSSGESVSDLLPEGCVESVREAYIPALKKSD